MREFLNKIREKKRPRGFRLFYRLEFLNSSFPRMGGSSCESCRMRLSLVSCNDRKLSTREPVLTDRPIERFQRAIPRLATQACTAMCPTVLKLSSWHLFSDSGSSSFLHESIVVNSPRRFAVEGGSPRLSQYVDQRRFIVASF